MSPLERRTEIAPPPHDAVLAAPRDVKDALKLAVAHVRALPLVEARDFVNGARWMLLEALCEQAGLDFEGMCRAPGMERDVAEILVTLSPMPLAGLTSPV